MDDISVWSVNIIVFLSWWIMHFLMVLFPGLLCKTAKKNVEFFISSYLHQSGQDHDLHSREVKAHFMACLDDPEAETRLVCTCEKHAVTAGLERERCFLQQGARSSPFLSSDVPYSLSLYDFMTSNTG